MFPLKDNIPTRRLPIITIALIVANVAVFLFFQEPSLSLTGAAVDDTKVVRYGVIPYEVTHPGKHCEVVKDAAERTGVACEGKDGVPDDLPIPDQPPALLTLLTSMFMHGGILHIAGNMLFLWIFGNNVEDSMGRHRFVLFYVLGGLIAAAAQILVSPDSTSPTIGASGAVAAVLGGYALLYPRARVVTLIIVIFFITLVELPALLVLGGWFLLQLFYAGADLTQPLSGGGGGVAYFAHIGGFVFGLALIKLFADRVHDDYDAHGRIPVY